MSTHGPDHLEVGDVVFVARNEFTERNLVDLVGQRGRIRAPMPVHPNTWYHVLLDNGKEKSFRRPCLDRNPPESTCDMIVDDESSVGTATAPRTSALASMSTSCTGLISSTAASCGAAASCNGTIAPSVRGGTSQMQMQIQQQRQRVVMASCVEPQNTCARTTSHFPAPSPAQAHLQSLAQSRAPMPLPQATFQSPRHFEPTFPPLRSPTGPHAFVPVARAASTTVTMATIRSDKSHPNVERPSSLGSACLGDTVPRSDKVQSVSKIPTPTLSVAPNESMVTAAKATPTESMVIAAKAMTSLSMCLNARVPQTSNQRPDHHSVATMASAVDCPIAAIRTPQVLKSFVPTHSVLNESSGVRMFLAPHPQKSGSFLLGAVTQPDGSTTLLRSPITVASA